MRHCHQGDWQPWVICDCETTAVVGAMATRVVEYESGMRACIIVACATEDTHISWRSMRKVVSRVEEFAKYFECDIVRILGRPGWARVLRDYTTSYVCIDKTIAEVSS